MNKVETFLAKIDALTPEELDFIEEQCGIEALIRYGLKMLQSRKAILATVGQLRDRLDWYVEAPSYKDQIRLACEYLEREP